MIIKNTNSELILSDRTGSIISYCVKGTQFCVPGGEFRPLFTIKLLGDDGQYIYHNSLEAEETVVEARENGCRIRYNRLAGCELYAVATITVVNEEIHWNLHTENGTGLRQEWVEFPMITVPNQLAGEGGEFDLFWPAMEGLLIRTTRQREILGQNYREIGEQSQGFGGFYPGICNMQFMTFYNKDAGLYMAAHDPEHHPKVVEYRAEEEGIALEFRLFTDGVRGNYEMDYDMVTAGFCGDWQDGAEKYRLWMEQNTILPPKLKDNKEMPSWLEESPLVMIYPVRGTKDTGDMTPNLYFPYSNILPVVERFADKTDSKIMSLMMHWEGTAPWAPPYVWPPFGGEEMFTKFVDQMHERGNLVGVYCSGIGWTVKSVLQPDYRITAPCDESLFCRMPDGSIQLSKVIPDTIRDSLDMCSYQTDKVGDIAAGEVLAIAASGCDYAQYFDQNVGGESCFCYAEDHGHPAGPGLWQKESMITIFKRLKEDLKKMGSAMLIGCECAASEPFIGYLSFNDLRYVFGLQLGQPVPAYAYLFHEYLNNFMGNQDWVEGAVLVDQNPECLLFRLAYSFTAGDMLSLTLGDAGNVIWGWGTLWDKELPDQEQTFTLVKNLNCWRRAYKEYLHTGRMVKPMPLEGVKDYTLYLRDGDLTLKYKTLLTSRWQNESGEQRQVIVNFMPYEQSCKVSCSKVYRNPEDAGEESDGNLTIPSLSAVWVS